ncbi:T-complex protein 1 subunit gamma, partial [Pancytospora epiphaga]
MQRQIQKAYILVSNGPSEVQKASAYAAKTLSSIVRTCLGPRAMQKMVLTKINSIEMTNDGNSILREMDVSHPSARCLIELSQTQDDVCGDGTTSVVVLAAELLDRVVGLLEGNHPVKVCQALGRARDICIGRLEEISEEVKIEGILEAIRSGVATKVCSILKVPIPELALRAAMLVKNATDLENGESFNKKRIDIKNDIRVEKILGVFEECEVIEGVLIEKDLVHAQMRRKIESPSILLLDSALEYKKGESVTSFEFSKNEDFSRALQIEEDQIRTICNQILELKPDMVITEKGICDLALSILYENGVTALRRVRKSDLLRISKATGATIMNRIEDLDRRHLGVAGLFEYVKINNMHYCRLSRCKKPRAVTVVLRGPTKDILTELERNFMDAVKIGRNILECPLLVPGGGSSEMSMALSLQGFKGSELENKVFSSCGEALKSIPAIIATNSGVDSVLDLMTRFENELPSKPRLGINGITGELVDARDIVQEPLIVKKQCVKSAFEAVLQLLRVDGI